MTVSANWITPSRHGGNTVLYYHRRSRYIPVQFPCHGLWKNPTEEYESEMAKAKIQAELYASTQVDKVDEKNIQMPDAAGLSKEKYSLQVAGLAMANSVKAEQGLT